MAIRRDSRGRFAGGGPKVAKSRALRSRGKYIKDLKATRHASDARLKSLKAAIRAPSSPSSKAKARALQNDRRALKRESQTQIKLGKRIGNEGRIAFSSLQTKVQKRAPLASINNGRANADRITRSVPVARFRK